MKKSVFAFMAIVLAGFTAAVGLCVRTLFSGQAVAAFSQDSMRIVLDAGHGGVDGGVTGKTTGLKESDVNLMITQKLYDILTDIGFEVTMTRKTEAGLYDTATKGFKKRDMQRRKEIIESVRPALVISVHQNFYASKAVRGGQVFYNRKDERSHTLSLRIQDELNELYRAENVKTRKVSTGDYFMLDCYPCPSVIVECGFLSNARDEELLNTSFWQMELAEAIATGIIAYYAEGTA